MAKRVKIRATFRFKQGHELTIRWVERDPAKYVDTEEGETIIPLTAKETLNANKRILMKEMGTGGHIALEDAQGAVHIVKCEEVAHIVMELDKEGKKCKTLDAPTLSTETL